LMNAVDFFPTFCKLAGMSLPKNVKFDGEDLSASFFGKNVTRKKQMFWEYGGNRAFAHPEGGNRSPNVAVRDGKWKLLVNDDGTRVELYDIEADQNETQNVSEKNSKIAKRLTESALNWRKSQP
jgi:arylsulfatase A-like enzyme